MMMRRRSRSRRRRRRFLCKVPIILVRF